MHSVIGNPVIARCPINGAGCRRTCLIDSRKQPVSAADGGVACTTPFLQCFTFSFANGRIFCHGIWKVTVGTDVPLRNYSLTHCRYRIGTESPIRRRPILLDRSDLILAGSFDPYLKPTTGSKCLITCTTRYILQLKSH